MSKPVYDSMPVQDFIRRYGKPYDLETDDYERPPFIADIKEGKNDPIYRAHSYHTKVPPRAIIPYILHYTEPGDIVLDPFCGSGMTGVAAMMCEDPSEDLVELVQGQNPGRETKKGARRAVLNDLSPAACHIAYNYCTPVDVEELKREFERIKAAIKDEFDWLYGTEHYEPAVELYDPVKPEVAARLKNPPSNVKNGDKTNLLGDIPERTWELISRSEVQQRMGPEALEKAPLPENVERFICIPATIQYTVWSDVHRCEGMVDLPVAGTKRKRKAARGCGKEIVLWDVAVESETGKVRQLFQCPHCGQEWKKTRIPRARSVPVLTNYKFEGLKQTKKGIVEATVRTERPTSQKEKDLIAEIEAKPIPYWVPDVPWDKSREMWRGGHRDARIFRAAHFYTRRNLIALSRLWHDVLNANQKLAPALRFALTGVCTTGSLMNTHHSKGQARPRIGTMYVPSFTEDANIQRLLNGKMKSQPKVFKYLQRICPNGMDKCVSQGSATSLIAKDSSVDYIFADPPFGSNIFYADCSFLWEAWLGDLTDRKQEAVWNKSRKPEEGGKTLDDYGQLMSASFSEMYRVLKPGRWATVEFNNSDGRVFEVIKKAARDAGFEIANMLFLDKDQKSFKQVKGAKGDEDVVKHDVIFNLHKPAPSREFTSAQTIADDKELEQIVMERVREHLRTLPECMKANPDTHTDEHRTTPFLNTMLMNTLIPKGADVERLNLPFIDGVCARYFRKIDNRWYLPDEAVGNSEGRANDLFQQEIDVKGEISAIEWLRQQLTNQPMMLGEIKPLWMRATVKLTNDLSIQLERLLRENFWLDRSNNKWREPTEDERSQMDTTERQQVRHKTERFLSGALKQTPTDAEMCVWIGTLYDAAKAIEEEAATVSANGEVDSTPGESLEIYRQTSLLFQRVLAERVERKVYTVAARQARMAELKLRQAGETQRSRIVQKTFFG